MIIIFIISLIMKGLVIDWVFIVILIRKQHHFFLISLKKNNNIIDYLINNYV
jgi:hypothetical protein